ncbi:MAG: phenylalanine 4-monooxygenase [Gammaproteobacteria bacterium]|nr:phenylalanine 4-monooxygenase [Gammaproteobacteria bacterium]
MKATSYTARTPDVHGYVDYSAEENQTWAFLYERQMKLIADRACDEFLKGLEVLQLTPDRVPQLPDVNRNLSAATGWEVAAVPALIPFGAFFELLANRRFPAATFIRRPEHIDYLQEPDIFHEIFGHGPLLTDPVFADFCQAYGKLGLAASKPERVYLARLFWFTVEFGLIETAKGRRIYGAGILSSKGESVYALDSELPERRPFELMTALRTPYRIDIFQTVYYAIRDFRQIFEVMNADLLPAIAEAMVLGDFPPTYPPKTPPAPVEAERKTHVC